MDFFWCCTKFSYNKQNIGNVGPSTKSHKHKDSNRKLSEEYRRSIDMIIKTKLKMGIWACRYKNMVSVREMIAVENMMNVMLSIHMVR